MGENEPVMVEVPPVEVPKTKETEPSTEKDFADAGFTPEEITMAKEQGMLTEPKKEGEKRQDGEKSKEGEKVKEGEEKKPEVIDRDLSDKDIKDKLDGLQNEDGTIKDKNAHGLYSQMRRDRKKRKEVEDVLRRKVMENKYLNDNLEKLKTERESIDQELADLKDKGSEYLTDEEKEQRAELRTKEKDLKIKEKEIADKTDKDKINLDKAERASRIVQETEDDYKKSHPGLDFDKCAGFASEIMKSLNDETIGTLIGDEMKSAYAEKIARNFVRNSMLLANGEITDEDLPVLVHKLAMLHPDYKDGSALSEVKGKDLKDGKIKPDAGNIDRMIKNADRNKSNTAAMGGSGGGRIRVSEDDLTWENAARLPKSEFDKLSDATIKRLEKESCGVT